MAGRGSNQALNHILERMANVLENMNQNLNRNAGPAEYQGLSEFKKNNPSPFKEGYDPEGAQTWLQELEKIF